MFRKLYELGNLLHDGQVANALNEGMPAVYDRGLAICFDESGRFSQVAVVPGNEGVIYRSGPPNGTDYTPCCKFSKATAKRLPKAVHNLIASGMLPPREERWLKATLSDFGRHQAAIWKEIEAQSKAAGIDGLEHRGYVFWARMRHGRLQPVYQWASCKQFLVESVLSNWKGRGGVRKNGICYFCGEAAKQVFGNFSILACYNLDKASSIAGGFNEVNGAKNFPVCQHCAIRVSGALVRIQHDLTSTMAGQRYMLVPYGRSPEGREKLRRLLADASGPLKLRSARQCDLISQECVWEPPAAVIDDDVVFAFIFFEQENASWRIQSEVQPVLPSRLQEIYRACRTIMEAPDLFFQKRNADEKAILVDAYLFRNFSEASEKKSGEIFRSWLAALLIKEKIDYRHFLHHLVKRILAIGKRESALIHWTLCQAWAFYRYACMVQLITPETGGDLMGFTIPESPYGRYTQEHPEFFNSREKAAAFLTGCYLSIVAGVQSEKGRHAPLAKKFAGRLLNRDQLKRLYREGHERLSQYGALERVSRTIDPDLAQVWVGCGEDWRITDEEATFAFMIGFSLEKRIRDLAGRQRRATTGESTPGEYQNAHP